MSSISKGAGSSKRTEMVTGLCIQMFSSNLGYVTVSASIFVISSIESHVDANVFSKVKQTEI